MARDRHRGRSQTLGGQQELDPPLAGERLLPRWCRRHLGRPRSQAAGRDWWSGARGTCSIAFSSGSW